MNVTKLKLEGVCIIEPKIFRDDRGLFLESFNEKVFREYGISDSFVQDNHSVSSKGVLRGLHFQYPPFSQGKLVRVVQGSVLDVVVDLRKDSLTYGEYIKEELSASNFKMLWIPSGFAHGFVSLEDNTVFQYKCTDYYNQSSEESIVWNDSDLKIDWGVEKPIVSSKDLQGKPFREIEFSS